MNEYDSFDELDQQIEEEKAHNSRFQNLLTLKDGDIVTFRILKEALPFIAFKEHTNFERGNKAMCFQAVCAAETGQPCHYCKEYEETGEKAFKLWTAIVYPVFIQDWQNPRATADGQSYLAKQVSTQKLWIIKCHSKQDQHHTVRDYYKRYKSILKAEWEFSRRGEGTSTIYKLNGYPTDAGELPLMSGDEVRTLLLSTLPPRVVEEFVVTPL